MKNLLIVFILFCTTILSAQLKKAASSNEVNENQNARHDFPTAAVDFQKSDKNFQIKTFSTPDIDFLESGLKAGFYNDVGVPAILRKIWQWSTWMRHQKS